MKRLNAGIALLWTGLALVAGWAFMKMTEPANVLNLLQLFSLC